MGNNFRKKNPPYNLFFPPSYTGEDGFELSVPSSRAAEVFERLLSLAPVRAAGLGARDSLRLEAGLCLYGSDIDGGTTPAEAALAWTVGEGRTFFFPVSDNAFAVAVGADRYCYYCSYNCCCSCCCWRRW